MKFHTLRGAAILGLVIACLAIPSIGAMLTSDPNFPPLTGGYESTSAYSGVFPQGVIVKGITMKDFTASQTPLGPGGSATWLVGATCSGLASPDGGITFLPYSGLADLQYRIDSATNSGSTRNFNLELLQMNLTVATPFGPMMLRESPTLPSLGQLTLIDLGGGQYSFDSFYDIFTELSTDGGQTWLPSMSPADHQVLVPEPATLSLLALGAVALLRRKIAA